ncbi:MAG: alpha/beta hydrolase-fold protein [Bacteroidales bacterium]|jgi:alpha-glucosidase|nr:alpha/beta hydrolase-fold protein [Bacteroidales bacterium]
MKKILAFIILVSLSATLFAQVTFILKSIPENTPRDSKFYLAGMLNKWQPNHSDYEFTKDNLGRLSLTLEAVPDTFEYKICRGDWTSVEVDSAGRDIANRLYVDSLGNTIVLDIKNWRDRMNPRQLVSTASKSVFFTPTSIEIPQLNRRRTVRVYFPPNYSSSQGFPVIYMFDGQNLFDASTAFAGEWRVDEVMDSLFERRGLGCIVVAIYHGEDERLNEYTPWPNNDKLGGDGAKFAQFIVRDLKPYIDKYYRTLPDRNNTIIMGSSLGGLMALYTALEYPKVFGKAGVFSPSLWWSEEAFTQIEKFRKRQFQKIYLYGGEKESESLIPNIERAEKLLQEVGFSENEIFKSIAPDGRHNEYYWGREFPEALKWMFGIQ